jgi:steroid delta-isomerase-like uncharacterized protein
MKKLLMVFPLVFLLCFTFACQDKEAMEELEAMKAQAEVEEQNIALVTRHYEAWNSGDVEAIKEIFSPDYIYHSGSGQDFSLDQTIEWLNPQMAAYPDRILDVEDILAKGDKVVSRYIFKGTQEGDIEGLPATGKKIEYPGIEIWRVENGKIVESWDIQASLSGAQQLGFELKLKEGEK